MRKNQYRGGRRFGDAREEPPHAFHEDLMMQISDLRSPETQELMQDCAALTQAASAIGAAGARFGEVFVEDSVSLMSLFHGGKHSTSRPLIKNGLSCRSASTAETRFVHAAGATRTSLRSVCDALRHATSGCEQVSSGEPTAASSGLSTDPRLPSLVDEAGLEAGLTVEAVGDIFNDRLSGLAVQQMVFYLKLEDRTTCTFNIDRAHAVSQRCHARLGLQVVLLRDGKAITSSASIGTNLQIEKIGAASAERLASRVRAMVEAQLSGDPEAGPSRPVVLKSGFPAMLVHEAVGHGLEADSFNREGSAFNGLLGKRVAAPGLFVDDLARGANDFLGFTADDEGNPVSDVPLLDDGILVGLMHDNSTASRAGVRPTGNGRRQGYDHQPMPRMRNTLMRKGSATAQAIVAAIDDGLYVEEIGPGKVDPITGEFRFLVTLARRISKGKLGELVAPFSLSGDGPTALLGVSAIGNDPQMDDGEALCRKEGQDIYVGVGQPTVCIEGLRFTPAS